MSIIFLAQVLEIIYYMCLVALPATISDIQYWVIIAHFYSVYIVQILVRDVNGIFTIYALLNHGREFFSIPSFSINQGGRLSWKFDLETGTNHKPSIQMIAIMFKPKMPNTLTLHPSLKHLKNSNLWYVLLYPFLIQFTSMGWLNSFLFSLEYQLTRLCSPDSVVKLYLSFFSLSLSLSLKERESWQYNHFPPPPHHHSKLFKCLVGDSSVIHHWNHQLNTYLFPLRKYRIN